MSTLCRFSCIISYRRIRRWLIRAKRVSLSFDFCNSSFPSIMLSNVRHKSEVKRESRFPKDTTSSLIQKNAQSVKVPPAMKIFISCIMLLRITVSTSIERIKPALTSLQIFLVERLFSFISFHLLSIDNPYRKPS